jgi:hypothetical protein
VGVARDPWQLLPSDPLVHLLGLQVPLVVCSGAICASFVTAAASLIRSRASAPSQRVINRRQSRLLTRRQGLADLGTAARGRTQRYRYYTCFIRVATARRMT